MYPEDVDPESGCRLPLPRREQLNNAGRRTYDGTVNLSAVVSRLTGQGGMAIYILAAMLLISAQTWNVCVLAALCSAAVR